MPAGAWDLSRETGKSGHGNAFTDTGTVPRHPSLNPMIKSVTDELRAMSQRCTRLAREVSDDKLSRALEELAVDLALKAEDLDRHFDSPI